MKEPEIIKKLEEMNVLRSEKRYEESDKIRDELQSSLQVPGMKKIRINISSEYIEINGAVKLGDGDNDWKFIRASIKI